jgi:hypothetical protein
MAAALSAFGFLLAGALAVREVDDLCAGFLGDSLQFCPPEKGLEQSQFCSVHCNDGETRPARTLADVSALPDKDLGHRNAPFVVGRVLARAGVPFTTSTFGHVAQNDSTFSLEVWQVIFIGLDDTDNLESRGTGHLARQIAAALAADYRVLGVTRHQLLVDPRVPCTKNNSSAAILVDVDGDVDPTMLLQRVRALVADEYQAGSDPGLCLARQVPAEIIAFGYRAKRQLVTQDEARLLAASHDIPLLGLGGDEGGVIGALAAVGLAASGEDGRYPLVGRSRELAGLQPVSALLAAGVAAVQTCDGRPVTDGLVQCDKLRPARRCGQPILVVERVGDHWLPVKLD